MIGSVNTFGMINMVAIFAFFVCVAYEAPWYVFLIGFLLLLMEGK